MRWKRKMGQNPYMRHQWFAWHPVEVDGEWVWLEKVWRRKVHGPSWDIDMDYWDYS